MKPVRFLLAAVVLACPVGALAQTTPTADPCAVQGGSGVGDGRELRFQDATVGGCLTPPPVPPPYGRPKKPIFESLIQVRANFAPELETSIADL